MVADNDSSLGDAGHFNAILDNVLYHVDWISGGNAISGGAEDGSINGRQEGRDVFLLKVNFWNTMNGLTHKRCVIRWEVPQKINQILTTLGPGNKILSKGIMLGKAHKFDPLWVDKVGFLIFRAGLDPYL